MSLVIVVSCQVEVSASGLSFVRRSPTECGVSECDREASIMRRPLAHWGAVAPCKKNYVIPSYIGLTFKCGMFVRGAEICSNSQVSVRAH
jgi:hypothetical protein